MTNKYGMVVFRTFDEGNKFLMNDTPFTAKEMKEFFESHRYPYVSEFE